MECKSKATRLRSLVACGFVAGAVAVVPQLHAGSVAGNGGSTEVTQILNNIQLLMHTVQQVEDYVVQAYNMEELIKSNLPSELSELKDGTQKIIKTKADIDRVITSSERLWGSLSNLKRAGEDRFRSFAASGLTWDQYIKREMDRIDFKRKNNSLMTEREAESIKSVKDDYDHFQRFAAQIPDSVGANDALQLLNGQMNGLLVTMNRFVELSSNRALAENTQRDLTLGSQESDRKMLDAAEQARLRAKAKARSEAAALVQAGGL